MVAYTPLPHWCNRGSFSGNAGYLFRLTGGKRIFKNDPYTSSFPKTRLERSTYCNLVYRYASCCVHIVLGGWNWPCKY